LARRQAAAALLSVLFAGLHVLGWTGDKAKSLLLRSRAGSRLGLAALLLVISCESLQNAVAEGDTRSISLHHVHTGEDITITYKRNGRYDEEALGKLNWFLRDWRTNAVTKMDPQLFDVLWEVEREVDAKEPLQVIGGYRSPKTNAMLRRRSSGVARTSQHMAGRAMDFFIPGVPLEKIRIAGLRLQRGGVGYYPTSGSPFVHIDTGSIRHWPRMTHDQLARVFPEGKTVHIPSDGHPLPGYALALAAVEKRGNKPSAMSLEAARSNGVNTSKLSAFAKLLGFGKNKGKEDDESDDDASAPATTARTVPKQPVGAPETSVALTAVPLPQARPQAAFQLASAPSAAPAVPERPEHAAAPQAPAANAGAPGNVFASRGFWRGLPEPPPDLPETSAAKRRPTEPNPDPTATGAIGPFATPDRVPPELALAYAAHAADPRPPAASLGPVIPRAVAAGTTVALKSMGSAPSVVESAPLAPVPAARKSAGAFKPVQRYGDPWLRAVTLTPSVEHVMRATLLGMPDYLALQPLLRRPSSVVVMTFCADPYLGLTTTHFSGPAVVFVATATFTNRTAFLR
jgi:uncharacterized protein YcbK (DUF882 family)